MTLPIDIAGQRYGRLVAVKRDGSFGKKTAWAFKCDCGSEPRLALERVRNGMTKSCGCLRNDTIGALRLSHGHSKGYRRSPELRAWYHAKGRCFNPTDAKFPHYGGRGITMCKAWADDFAAFLQDMGPRPKGTTLDRLNPDGNYEPGNCRWATTHQQARTRTGNVFVEHEGKRMVLKDFAQAVGVSYRALWRKMKMEGMAAHEAASSLG